MNDMTKSKGNHTMKSSNKISLLALAAAALSMATMTPASAQNDEKLTKGPYVGFKFGINRADDQQFQAGGEVTPVAQGPIVIELPRMALTGPSSTYEYDNEMAYAATLGYMFSNGLRPEFELSYRQDKPDSITNSSGGAESSDATKISVSTAFGNLWYDFFRPGASAPISVLARVSHVPSLMIFSRTTFPVPSVRSHWAAGRKIRARARTLSSPISSVPVSTGTSGATTRWAWTIAI